MRDGANSCHSTLSDSDTSGCFGTTKLNQRPEFGDDHSALDASYEEATSSKSQTGSECVPNKVDLGLLRVVFIL